MERILVLNLGSTSSKIAVFDGEEHVCKASIRHTAEELSAFDDILDQFDFRNDAVRKALAENGIDINSITCVCSRGGAICPCPHGAIGIDRAMIDFLTRPEETAKHASLLGSMIAFAMHEEMGIPAFIYDAIGTDEKIPVARVSGVPELPHYTIGHTLNTRAMAIKCAEEKLGRPFEECTFIVAHLGGGSSIRLYKDGINIDSVNDDEGNFSCERGGGVGAKKLIDMCFSGKYSYKEMMKKIHGNGGLMAHFGTADAIEVEARIAAGDEYARIVYEAMAYKIGKDIGRLAAAVCGKVDRIILTGGIAYSRMITDRVSEMVSFIAPVEVMPGEYETEALAAGALRVLQGKEQLQDFAVIMAEAAERIRIPGTPAE